MKIKTIKRIFQFKFLIKTFELISFLKKPTKRKFVFIVFAMFINSVMEFITIGSIIPFITFISNPSKISEIEILKLFSRFFNIQKTEELFLFISLLFLLIIILSGIIKILSFKMINQFAALLKIELGNKLYKTILYQDYEFHLNTNSSQLISTQIQQLDSAVAIIYNLMLLLLTFLTSFGIIISLVVIDPKIVSFIILGSFIFYLFASLFTKKNINLYGKVIFESRTNIIRIMQESLGYIRQIILDDSHKFFFQEYNKYNKNNEIAQTRSQILSAIPRYSLEVIVLSSLVITLIFINLSGIDFIYYVPVFGAFILGLQKLLPLFQKIFSLVYFMFQDKLNLYAVVELLKETKNFDISLRNKTVDAIELKNKIKLHEIYSSYKENNVLENINLEINKGDVIGIVGKTGAGKSTFVDLLLGLKKPTSGNIYIDEKKMNVNLFRGFRLSISSVPQDYFLLDRSLEENIVFGKGTSKIDYALLKQVVEIAMLSDFISSQRSGLKTFVGEGGVRLSGGQKQRLAIARALYKKHSVLVLDEATSSVDSETEKKILSNIVNNNPKLTIIMIAHRLQTLEKCNYILEIKDKKIIKHKNIGEYKSKFEK